MSGRPQEPRESGLVLGLLLAVVFCGLAYVTYEHPGLATPLTVAIGGVAVVVAVLVYTTSRR